jgi:hypothetical protein
MKLILSLISLVYQLSYSRVKDLVDAEVHSKHGKVIRYDFKPGSVKRSVHLDKEYTSGKRQYFSPFTTNENREMS